MELNNILGVVLAGGKSHRFGQDKSQVKFQDKLLIDYTLKEIVSEFNEILIIANDHINFMQSKKISITKDLKSGLGPLGGVLTAMKWVHEKKENINGFQLFQQTLLSLLKKNFSSFIKILTSIKVNFFFLRNKNTRHNIFGLWSMDLMQQLENDLLKGDRKVEIWANSIGVKEINIDNKKPDPFFNINTKEDLKKANEIINND